MIKKTMFALMTAILILFAGSVSANNTPKKPQTTKNEMVNYDKCLIIPQEHRHRFVECNEINTDGETYKNNKKNKSYTKKAYKNGKKAYKAYKKATRKKRRRRR